MTQHDPAVRGSGSSSGVVAEWAGDLASPGERQGLLVELIRLAGIASSFLEADPTVTWDAERIDAVHRAMESLTVPTA